MGSKALGSNARYKRERHRTVTRSWLLFLAGPPVRETQGSTMGAKYVIGVLMVACSFPGLFLTLNSKFDSDSLISLAVLSFFALSGIFLMRERHR